MHKWLDEIKEDERSQEMLNTPREDVIHSNLIFLEDFKKGNR